jgi:hypothetical protein
MEKIVTSCLACPFSFVGDDIQYCSASENHIRFDDDKIFDNKFIHPDCPLKKESITISIKH